MKYIYFVSFNHSCGFGNVDVKYTQPITGIEDIRLIEKSLMEENNKESLIINNYILLRTENAN